MMCTKRGMDTIISPTVIPYDEFDYKNRSRI